MARKNKIHKTQDGVNYVTQPYAYKPEYCDMLVKHMAKGFSYQSFAGEIDVCFKTLYNWEKDFPAWKAAKERGNPKNLKIMEAFGLKAMSGGSKGISSAIYCFTMKNRYPEIYKDVTEIIHKNIPEKITPEEAAKAYDKVTHDKS
jgi:hypothetical protein